MKTTISEKPFGSYEGNPVTEYSLQNKNGMLVSIINYGATITKIMTADHNAVFANVVNSFDKLDDYIKYSAQYIGCTVGRYCNRIANASFSLNGKEYLLAKNNHNNCLHGGNKGFDKAYWHIEKRDAEGSLQFTYLSKHMEEGFPGNVDITVTYTLTQENELIIDYAATADQATPVNLTNHSYFNLSGNHDESILNHELEIFADSYTPVNESLIPTGEIEPVKHTPIDFISAKKVGRDLTAVGGYDHNLIINKSTATSDITKAATVYDPNTGRFMEMFTTEPAVQFYSGNAVTGPGKQAGLCLEAQHYPNSPNEASFPNTVLRPGEKYKQTTIYKFSAKPGGKKD
ncbi:MAG: galactose mutarotase [Ferruginibacter sp.]|nr:galactose mutarotase [Ferruginibacter sp.]